MWLFCAAGAGVHQITFLHSPQFRASYLSPEPDELPDCLTDVGGALCAGYGLVEVSQLLSGDWDASGALAQVVVLLQTLQRCLEPAADYLL